MRIVLIYPPPWKIPRSGAAPYPPGEGPYGAVDAMALTGDMLQAPYGLLSIAAQVMNAGHRVWTFNLANTPWKDVEHCIRSHPADLYGISCITANRRGTHLVAGLIRRLFPTVHIVAGGPHVTALPVQTLDHCGAIDTVVMGEGEATFLALAQCLAGGGRPAGLRGTAWRDGTALRVGPPPRPIADLDALVPPVAYFDLRTLVTTRGCPGNCTFCASRLMWGGRIRFHSARYVLDMLEKAAHRHGRSILAIKDDTFTADRRRVQEICRGIRERQLKIMWSCDTRADHLDLELLHAMRLAGCQRISIGVESGCQAILARVNKRISLETVTAVAGMAKKVGLQLRFYMMVGNRGETPASLGQSLDLIRRARPNQFVFSQLHLYPGTREFAIFQRKGAVASEDFITKDAMNLTAFGGTAEDLGEIRPMLEGMQGIQDYWRYGVADLSTVMARLPDLPAANMDLCGAYLRQGRVADAEDHLDRAVAGGYCLPGLVFNARACMAAERMDIPAAEAWLARAVDAYPHQVVVDNLARLASWQAQGGVRLGTAPRLDPGGAFETAAVWNHPETPLPVGKLKGESSKKLKGGWNNPFN